jgi:hypothetical protein
MPNVGSRLPEYPTLKNFPTMTVMSTTGYANAPNLGKLFTNRTSRPATPEDIALLSPGDWISERDCPWSWQFKNSYQDMAIGVWEGKEFFIPHHLLMVCEVVEGKVVEKFFRKPEPKFKVGDRVIAYKGKPAASAVIHDARIENGRIQIIWDDVQDKKPRWFAIDTLRLEQETDLSFKKSTTSFSVGDRFAVYPGVTNECEIIGLLGSKYRVRWSLKGDQMTVDAAFLANLKPIQISEEPEKLFINESDDGERWNPDHFSARGCANGEVPHQIEPSGQATIFYDAGDEPPDPDDFETTEEYEEALNQWENSQQECSLPVAVDVAKERSPQDTSPSGRSNATPTPQPSTENDSPQPNSSNKTLPPLATNLSGISPLPKLSLPVFHAPISPFVEKGQELKELADNCFLNSSDSWKSKSLICFSLKMSLPSSAVETVKTSKKSSERLQKWGIWGLGKCETEIATHPKTESESLLWVSSCDVGVTHLSPGKKSLAEIIGEYSAIVYRAAGGDRIYHEQSPCLRSPNNSGTGAYKIREYQGENYLERPINAIEAEQLMGWEVGSTATGINKEGDEISISQTQRIKMIGNGIIVGEIIDILTAIKPILLRRLKSEIPEHLEFAYRQLRQKKYTHQEAVTLLTDSR